MDETILKFIGLNDIESIEVVRRDGKYIVNWLDKEEVAKGVDAEMRHLVDRSEKAILNITKQRLVRTSILRNGLNPIIEIIGLLIREGEFKKREVAQNNLEYLKFLKNLNYIDLEDSTVFGGKELNKFYLDKEDNLSETELIDIVLGDILKDGYPYLKEMMRIKHVTPFLRLTNANLFPSSIKGERVHFQLDDFIRSEKTLYGKTKVNPRIKTLNHLNELERVGVFDVEDGYYVANEGVWEDYRMETPSLAI